MQSIVSSALTVYVALRVDVLVESIVDPWLRSDAAQVRPVN